MRGRDTVTVAGRTSQHSPRHCPILTLNERCVTLTACCLTLYSMVLGLTVSLHLTGRCLLRRVSRALPLDRTAWQETWARVRTLCVRARVCVCVCVRAAAVRFGLVLALIFVGVGVGIRARLS